MTKPDRPVTREAVDQIMDAQSHLQEARTLLALAGSHTTAARVQTALEAVDGVLRDAEGHFWRESDAARDEWDEAVVRADHVKRAIKRQRIAAAEGNGNMSYQAKLDLIAAHGRIDAACDIARRYGGIEGDHHRAWVIDQMVRALTGPDYEPWVAERRAGKDGPHTYDWDEGIAP